MSISSLQSIVLEPQVTATAAVIWLHGLGDSGAGFAPIVAELGLPENHSIRFIFPHALEQAVTINQGEIMRSWYDIKSADLHDRADMAGILESELLVQTLIQEQIDSGIVASKIVLAGFSQGGVVSLFTALRYPQKIAGILALSCYLPTTDNLPEHCHDANKNTPILQHHGEEDAVVPILTAKMAQKLLKANGYQAQWKTYAMEHTVSAEQIIDISVWLQIRLIH